MKNPSRWSKSQAEHSDLVCGQLRSMWFILLNSMTYCSKHLQIGMLPYFLESRSQKSEKKQKFKHVCNGKCKCNMEIIFT